MPRRGSATFLLFYRRVVERLASSIGKSSANRLALKWRGVVHARWREGKSVDNVARHVSKYETERVVCPCRRGSTHRDCPAHRGGARFSRDPSPGEVYESKNGNRWKVVGKNMKGRIILKRAPSRFEGEVYWTPEMLSKLRRVGAADTPREVQQIVQAPSEELRFKSGATLSDRLKGMLSGDPGRRRRR